MLIDEHSGVPIFIQIAQGLEEGILSGAFPEGGQIPSITDFSVTYKINPATALKGINMLVEAGIVHKRRGVGMFVSEGAVAALSDQRRQQFYQRYVVALTAEARRLGITLEALKTLVEKGYETHEH